MISNVFIDEYMPEAHGDYVKVYLYLLRHLYAPVPDLSVTSMAEHFDNTEKDILKAIQYWERQGLLKTERTKKGMVEKISLIKPQPKKQKQAERSGQAAETAAAKEMAAANEVLTAKKAPAGNRALTAKKPQPSDDPLAIPRPVYSAEQIAHMKENSQVRNLLENIERYLKRLLKPDDIQLVLYLYESLNFPPDLILYLYDYCISMNKTHRSYIEAVALNWNRDKIRTVEQAAATTAQYRKDYYTIAKALGFQRSLADAECRYIDKWLNEWGFPLKVVLEACNRTVLQIQSPSFQYADRILESWHKSGAKTLADIKKLDASFVHSANGKPKQSTGRINRFTAFEQHSYSSEDIREMEQALLQKSAERWKNH